MTCQTTSQLGTDTWIFFNLLYMFVCLLFLCDVFLFLEIYQTWSGWKSSDLKAFCCLQERVSNRSESIIASGDDDDMCVSLHVCGCILEGLVYRSVFHSSDQITSGGLEFTESYQIQTSPCFFISWTNYILLRKQTEGGQNETSTIEINESSGTCGAPPTLWVQIYTSDLSDMSSPYI